MNRAVIAVIGAGNMGESLIRGLITHGKPPHEIWATTPDKNRIAILKDSLSIQTTTNNLTAAKTANVIIFAVKPQKLAQVARELAPQIQQNKPLIISIAAGIRTEALNQWLGGNQAIIRAMPNTPALVNCGASALFANDYVSAAEKILAEQILSAVGLVLWVNDEAELDTVTALSGSGPAYFFLVMESLQEAAEKLGLPEETARRLTLETAYGAALMARKSHEQLAALRKKVTSPNGTTEKAISVLEDQNIRGIFEQALMAAKARSEELAKLLGKE